MCNLSSNCEIHGLFTLDNKFHVDGLQNGLMINIIIIKNPILVRKCIKFFFKDFTFEL